MKSYLKRKTAEQQTEAPEHDPERELGFAVVFVLIIWVANMVR